jgi:hypothetical protein
MTKGLAREVRDLALEALERGWEVRPTRRGHLALLCPCGAHLVHLAGTPSDRRSTPNARARLKRTGCWPPLT